VVDAYFGTVAGIKTFERELSTGRNSHSRAVPPRIVWLAVISEYPTPFIESMKLSGFPPFIIASASVVREKAVVTEQWELFRFYIGHS
jgi:hypothetical protein